MNENKAFKNFSSRTWFTKKTFSYLVMHQGNSFGQWKF